MCVCPCCKLNSEIKRYKSSCIALIVLPSTSCFNVDLY
uniref:Uncharacterized protein n=1 Tax=Anguilla anguilla TaxID=7936 RepID=A0A0E9UB88_ANGAN